MACAIFRPLFVLHTATTLHVTSLPSTPRQHTFNAGSSRFRVQKSTRKIAILSSRGATIIKLYHTSRLCKREDSAQRCRLAENSLSFRLQRILFGVKQENRSIERFKATAGFEPAIRVLQTPALPLGYVAVQNLQESMCIGSYQHCYTLSNKTFPGYSRFDCSDSRRIAGQNAL